jgi:L-threonylcarbamoyladenylate synthase
MANQMKLNKAVQILREGGLVAFPTETVYGLGADASNPQALAKIFAAKERPVNHPLIVHVGSTEQLSDWALEISEQAQLLAAAFWPGPMTLIFKKKSHCPDLLTGSQETIGIRIPQHPLALSLLNAFGGGIAAPSANRFGRISPTTALAVAEELGSSVDLILDGGQCAVGVESTIIDVSGATPAVLRPGMITVPQIEKVLQEKIFSTGENSPRVSGSHESHYAPCTPSMLVNAAAILEEIAMLPVQDFPLVVLTREKFTGTYQDVEFIKMPEDAKQYAHDLYATLRACDRKEFRCIVIAAVPDGAVWDAVRDRLQRACGKKLLPLS